MAELSTKVSPAPTFGRPARRHRDVRAAGNLTAQRLLKSGVIRAKLRIDGPGDRCEQEADRLADRMMSSPAPAPASAGQAKPCCSSCATTHPSGGTAATPGTSSAGEPAVVPGRGQPLPDSTRAFFEPRLGIDLADVRVHTGPRAARSAAALGARAYTTGHHIVFDHGEFRPESSRGQRLIGHELAHVAQQRRGAATPSVQRQKTTGEINWEQMRHSGPVDWKPGMRATVLQDSKESWGVVKRGTVVEVIANPGFGVIQVQAVDPAARRKEPLQINDIRLDPLGQAGTGLTAVAGDAAQPLTVFNVQLLDGATAQSLDIELSTLPEGQLIPLEVARQQAYPGVGFGMSRAPWPAFSPPAYATGVQWTQTGFGHFSQFANVPGQPTIGGYRSWLPIHAYQGAHHALTGQPWTRPVPGGYWNDWFFRMMGGDRQTMVYRQNTPTGSLHVADVIRAGSYKEPYTFPPVAPGTKCTNCITAPQFEVYEALGGKPVLVSPDGQIVDVTEMGRGSTKDPFTIEQAGRGKTVKEWLANPHVETPTGRIEPLQVTKVPGSTVWATRGVFVVRSGGYLMLVYGAYNTFKRLDEAAGTPHFNRVLAQETGSWVGGILGGALGTAAAGALFCAPSGPGALACFAGGFVLGLAGGALGSIGGALGADYLYEQGSQALDTAGEVFNPMIERAIWGNAPIPEMGYYPPRQFGDNPFEYEQERDRYMRKQSQEQRPF